MPQDALPFPPTPSASIAGRTMQESTYAGRVSHADFEDAPNILIVLIDDAGPGLPDTFGGEVRTDTLTRVLHAGHRVQPVPYHCDVLSYSGLVLDRAKPSSHRQRPDRRAGQRLGRLCRRNPQEQRPGGRGTEGLRLRHGRVRQMAQHSGDRDVGGRTVSQLANRDGVRVLLRFLCRRGFAVRAQPGAQHHLGPAARTPEEGYHLSEDLADDAIAWLHRHQAFEPDKPFFMYWASGCLHAPHHIWKEWSDDMRVLRRRLGRLPRARLRAPRSRVGFPQTPS